VGKKQDIGENYVVGRFMMVLLTIYLTKKDEMTEKKNTLRVWWRSLKDAGLLENLWRWMKIILK
jgi:hypothetical protein